jgi:hypothetical protein
MGYIFISYSHTDKPYVQKLADSLHARRFEVWIDQRIDYGEPWPHAIQEALDGCEAFIVVVSENSYKSGWVQNEVTRAQRKNKPFLPVLLSGDPWLSIEITQYVDVRDGSLPPPKFYDRLSQVLEIVEETKQAESKEVIPTSGKNSINIPISSSARGLREELERIARRRSVRVGRIVEQILTFAANNPGIFPAEIENPRPKPGKHISTKVTTNVAEKLTVWAKRLGRTRAAHCCFLLECVVDDTELLKKVFR